MLRRRRIFVGTTSRYKSKGEKSSGVYAIKAPPESGFLNCG